MDTTHDDKAPESRPPTLDDLVFVCRELNATGARYVIIGGMAIVQAGFARATEDIDLLLERSEENLKKVREALLHLPDGAIRELKEKELEEYGVVRIADEFVVDLMLSACGIGYDEAEGFIDIIQIQGVKMPFANPELLLRLKQTMREKDKLDLLFLEELLGKSKH